jgi:hypothetical protein
MWELEQFTNNNKKCAWKLQKDGERAFAFSEITYEWGLILNVWFKQQ